MYDIKNLNIWKRPDFFETKPKVLARDASKQDRRNHMTEKCQVVFDEIIELVPAADFAEIKKRRGGKLRFPMYLNNSLMETDLEVLDLSVRSKHCLRRAGFRTIGDVVEGIEGSEDLKKIKNCGAKSVDEIMELLFCYQYEQIEKRKKITYIQRILELNT